MAKAKPRCLEIGPELAAVSKGRPVPRIAPHWEILDTQKRPGVNHVAVWGKPDGKGGVVPLPLPDNAFDHVYASHVLEHIFWNDTEKALREVLRILKPGGRCEIWVPDFAKVVACYLQGKMGDKWRRHNKVEQDFMRWVNGRIFTYGPGADNIHRACFDDKYLKRCMERAGFSKVRRLKTPSGFDNHKWVNLGMDGRKP